MTEFRSVHILCPRCNEVLEIHGFDDQRFTCRGCAQLLEVERGIIDLSTDSPSLPKPPPRPQKMMESRPGVRAYGALRKPLSRLISGISFEKEVNIVLSAAEIERAEKVLDVACGTGVYALRFARAVRRITVVGFDLSRPMLEAAHRRAEADRIDNLLLVRANAARLPFPDAEFDVVNCGAAMHLFSPLAPFLAEMYRVLQPGGRLTAAVPRLPVGGASERLSRRAQDKLGIHSFEPGELERSLEQAGFAEIIVHHAYRLVLVVGALKPPPARPRAAAA